MIIIIIRMEEIPFPCNYTHIRLPGKIDGNREKERKKVYMIVMQSELNSE